jgi:hypothetical protein
MYFQAVHLPLLMVDPKLTRKWTLNGFGATAYLHYLKQQDKNN